MPLNTIDITRAQDINTSDISLQTQYRTAWNNQQYSTAFSIISSNPQLASKVLNNAFITLLVNGVLTLENFYGDNVTDFLNNLLTNWQSDIDSIQYLGDYQSSASYFIGNFVSYNDAIYMCIQNGVHSIEDTASWALLGLQGEDGAVGTGLSYVGTWSSTSSYSQYDMVSYGSGLYIAITGSTGANPGTSPNVWLLGVDATPRGILTGSTEPTGIDTGDIWWEYLD